MNIQVYGTRKCNDTKKAERFFKERGIKYQFIDMIGTLRISTYYNKTNIELLVNEINETK